MTSNTSNQSTQNTRLNTQLGKYLCVEILGKGGFGEVYRAINTITKQVYALKIIDKAKIEQQKSPRVKQIKKKLIISQSAIMMKCNSDHIVRCYQRFETPQIIVLVLQYCNKKDLNMQIKQKKFIPEKEAIGILKHIIEGFSELHKNKVIHRDLKTQNIFQNNQNYKIGDLGFAKIFPSLVDTEGTTLGTMTTMAPEVMKQEKYGFKADLWSLGIIYYQMIFGHLPIKFKNRQQMIKSFNNKIIIPQNNNCSQQSKNLLQSLLVPDPKKRISWQQLYNHQIFTKYQNSNIYDENFVKDLNIHQHQFDHLKITNQNQSFNIEQDLKNIQKSQQTGLPSLRSLSRRDTNEFISDKKYAEQLKKIDQQIFKYINQLMFQKQRSQLLLSNIVQNMITNFTPLKNKRFFYQFLFLVICRCFYIVSPINDALLKQNSFKWTYHKQFLKSSISQAYLNQFKQHYDIICKKKQFIEQQLYKQQNKVKNIVSDFFDKIFQKQKYEQKEKFCSGIQGQDFKMNDQIDYTLSNYVPKMLEQIDISEMDFIKQKKLNELKQFIIGEYKFINLATFQKDQQYLKAVSWKYNNK